RDVWETLFYHQICESLTWHVFDVPPTKVLDIGCGTGSWILDCARVWRNCHFVGLDIVPVQPDLQQVGSADLAHRVTWVQGNFLEGFPFPNEEFDFVHIKRISLGVPEDKWDPLFEEISRVMKPGAAFEMIEEDLLFPGAIVDPDDDKSNVIEESTSQLGLEVGAIVEDEEGEENAVLNDRRNDRQTDADAEHPTPSPSHLQYPTDSTITPSKLSHSKLDTSSVLSKSTLLRHPPSASTGSITDLHNASPYSFNPYAKLDSALAGSFLPPKRPLSPSNHGLLTNSSIHLPSLSFSQSVNSLSSNSPRSSTVVIGETSYESRTEANDSYSTINGAAAPFLLRTLPKSPVNPRDHSILELIYNEMNAARFVNLSPLSLLPNLLGLYFQDLRTHPPVTFTFPPKSDSVKPSPKRPTLDSDPDEDARDAIRPPSSSVSYSMTGSPPPSRTSHFEDATDHWVNMKQIVKRESPYIIYDDLRISAVSPSTRASILSPKKRPKPSFRLPNTTLNIDIRSLNLHLALRVTEILACSETMWEWVLEYQEQERVRSNRRLQETKHRTRSRSIGPLRPSSRDKTFVSESIDERLKAVLVDMTREDFDDMLRRFYSDMQDSMALPAVLEERFGWTNYPAPPSAERQAFEAECEKYQQWEAEQRTRKKSKFMSDQAFRQQTEGPIFASPISITDPSSILSGLPASRVDTKSHTKEHKSVSSTATFVKPQPNASLSAGSTAPPSQRISRSLRIFVAWKGVGIS
ncbi:hypothetical protein EV361DRAFT_797032, partial [Lentinula raphanica]